MTKTELNLAIIMSVNALIQFLLDLVLEILHLLPTRINHLSLTVLNAFVSWKTLSAIQKQKFRFVHEDVQVLFLMEICLIVGDVYYFIKDDFNLYFMLVRLFFLFCSTFNLIVVTYIIIKYGLWNLSYVGDSDGKGLMRRLSQRFRNSLVWDESVLSEIRKNINIENNDNNTKIEENKENSETAQSNTINEIINRTNELDNYPPGAEVYVNDDGESIGEPADEDSDQEDDEMIQKNELLEVSSIQEGNQDIETGH